MKTLLNVTRCVCTLWLQNLLVTFSKCSLIGVSISIISKPNLNAKLNLLFNANEFF